jgi:hypothetical protein
MVLQIVTATIPGQPADLDMLCCKVNVETLH